MDFRRRPGSLALVLVVVVIAVLLGGNWLWAGQAIDDLWLLLMSRPDSSSAPSADGSVLMQDWRTSVLVGQGILGLLAGAAIAAVAFYWARQETRASLEVLTEFAGCVAEGDPSARRTLEGYPGLETVAGVIEASFGDARSLRETLESRVAERTSALADRTERFRDFAESTADWLWETDLGHRFISFEGNTGGLDTSRVLGRTRSDLMEELVAAEVIAAHQADLDAHRPFRDLIYPIRLGTGQIQQVRTSGHPRFGADGQFLGYRGSGTDVTALIEADQRARALQVQLTTAISTMSEGFTLYDADDRLVLCNERYREIFPLIADYLQPGVRFSEVVATANRRGQYGISDAELPEWVARRLEIHRLPDPRPFLQYLPNGTIVRSIERRTPDGGVVGLCSDVTEEIRLQQQLTDAKDAAVSGSRAKSEFLATMSHEIRTPMNGVIGMTDLLMETRLDERQRSYARIVRESAADLLNIINDILEYSTMEVGKLALADRKFDPASVVESAVEPLITSAAAKNLELITYVDPAVPREVRGDPERIRQILVNLLTNAIKFTDLGWVTVEVEVLGVDVDNRCRLRCAVEDSGIGIAPEAIRRLFTVFSQIDASFSRRHGGTGLGLAICKRLVTMMGGVINVESTPGAGSRFWVELPLVVTAPHLAPPTALYGRRILLVDDNRRGRALRSRLLRGYGCEVASMAWEEGMRRLAGGTPEGGSPEVTIVVPPRQVGTDLDLPLNLVSGIARGCPVLLLAPVPSREPIPDAGQPVGIAILDRPPRRERLLRQLLTLTGTPSVPAVRSPTFEPSRRPLSILVAEDHPMNQELAAELLSRMGHTVDMVDNGEDAIRKVRAQRFDLVLMDVQLPRVDGLAAAVALRADGGASGAVPIIAVTAHALAGAREACLAAGMDDYLAKPIELRRLADLINRWGHGRQRAAVDA